MEKRVSAANVVSLARTVGAWAILSAMTLSFSVQFLTGFHEARTEDWPPAEFCRSASSAEPDQSGRADATLAGKL
jgi:hypothetical protein